MTSGDKDNLRPDSPNPWVADESFVQTITVQLTESPEDPTYVELVNLGVLENVDELRIRLVKDGEEQTIRTETVSRTCNLWQNSMDC